jgi:hypothetical protein
MGEADRTGQDRARQARDAPIPKWQSREPIDLSS